MLSLSQSTSSWSSSASPDASAIAARAACGAFGVDGRRHHHFFLKTALWTRDGGAFGKYFYLARRYGTDSGAVSACFWSFVSYSTTQPQGTGDCNHTKLSLVHP